MPELWTSIASAGLPALLMAVAIRYLMTSNEKLISRLDQERSERLDALERHVEACDKDRADLRQQLIDILSGAQPEHHQDHPTRRRSSAL